MINLSKAIVEEFATQESVEDTVMGLLLLSQSFASAIKLYYGPQALSLLSNHISSSIPSSTSYSPETLSVLSSNLHLINLMLKDS